MLQNFILNCGEGAWWILAASILGALLILLCGFSEKKVRDVYFIGLSVCGFSLPLGLSFYFRHINLNAMTEALRNLDPSVSEAVRQAGLREAQVCVSSGVYLLSLPLLAFVFVFFLKHRREMS